MRLDGPASGLDPIDSTSGGESADCLEREPDLPAHSHPPHRRRRVPRCLVHGPEAEADRRAAAATRRPPPPAEPSRRPASARPSTKAKKSPPRPPPTASAAATADRRPRTATTPAPAAERRARRRCAIPADALAKLPKDVADALKARKILVLGVFADGAKAWRPQADDDRYVRSALRKINRYDGDVFVKQVAISRALDLRRAGQRPRRPPVSERRRHRPRPQGPRADRLRRSRHDQPGDRRHRAARRPSRDITDTYLRDLNAYCGDRKLRLSRLSYPTSRGSRPPWLVDSALLARHPLLPARARRAPRLRPSGVRSRRSAASWRGRRRPAAKCGRAKRTTAAPPRKALRALRPTRHGGRPSLQRGRPHQLRGQPAVLDSSGRGPRAFRRASRRAHRARRLLSGGVDGHAGGSLCGDLIRVSVRVEGDRVVEAGFDADGCGALTAAGSAAVDARRGRAAARRGARRRRARSSPSWAGCRREAARGRSGRGRAAPRARAPLRARRRFRPIRGGRSSR